MLFQTCVITMIIFNFVKYLNGKNSKYSNTGYVSENIIMCIGNLKLPIIFIIVFHTLNAFLYFWHSKKKYVPECMIFVYIMICVLPWHSLQKDIKKYYMVISSWQKTVQLFFIKPFLLWTTWKNSKFQWTKIGNVFSPFTFNTIQFISVKRIYDPVPVS